MDTTTPVFAVQRAHDRAFFDFGWLKTYHSFSFADYYDPENLNWGALRVFNDDTVMPAKGFGRHPHRDMEIVTFVLHGRLKHEDSLGHSGIVEPGGVQYMSAGTGVFHSEFNADGEAGEPVHFCQMWVLPHTRGERPFCGQRNFDSAEREGRWLAVASGAEGIHAPIALRADATVRVARIRDGGEIGLDLAAGRFGFLFVAEGTAHAAQTTLGAGDALRLTGRQSVALAGDAELIFWDVPPTNVRLEDA